MYKLFKRSVLFFAHFSLNSILPAPKVIFRIEKKNMDNLIGTVCDFVKAKLAVSTGHRSKIIPHHQKLTENFRVTDTSWVAISLDFLLWQEEESTKNFMGDVKYKWAPHNESGIGPKTNKLSQGWQFDVRKLFFTILLGYLQSDKLSVIDMTVIGIYPLGRSFEGFFGQLNKYF